MDLKELKKVIGRNFVKTFGEECYKLMPTWESDKICQCGYAIVDENGIVVDFSASSTSIYDAKSTEILTNEYQLETWSKFVKGVKQECRDIWDWEHKNG